MTRPGTGRAAAFALLILCGLPGAWPGASWFGGTASAGPPPWEESTPGLFVSVPERTVEMQDNGIRGTFRLEPGQGIVYERAGRWPIDNGSALLLEISASAANASSKDYVPGDADFPVSVTLVFGDDSVRRPWADRIYDFFTGPWYGFLSGGVRLTYAFGHDAPVGSMYRLVEAETVFILGGPDEAGKPVASDRKIAEDFEAAYARAPKGPVTRVIARLFRPRAEKAPLSAGLLLGFRPR